MVGDGATYTLTGADSSAFCTLLQAQSALGPARQTPGQADFWAFYAAIDTFSYNAYTLIANAQLKSWVDKLYTALLQTQTCYGIDAAGMYALYVYSEFTKASFVAADYEPDNTNIVDFWINHGGKDADFGPHYLPNATPWGWFGYSGTGMWRPPAQPDAFYTALPKDVDTLNAALQAAKTSTSTVAFFADWGGTSPDPASLVQFEQSRFDPANWTDSGTFVTNLAGTKLWQEQHDAVTALLQPDTLSADVYFFLLHLLIALGTSDAKSQQLAQRVVSASATSQEYPNDTFVNQLVYLVLMYLADPLGNFAWTNAQLIAETTQLSGAIGGQDPASQAIRDSLARHRRVLQTDASYPLQDPYSPAIGFTQRQTDTLFALDKARAGLNQ